MNITQDLARIAKPSVFSGFRWYFFSRGECFPFVLWLRVLQAVKRCFLLKLIFGPFVYLIYRHYEFKYGIHANSNIEIGGGLRVVHGPCNLNAAKIGANFTVYSGVTIGYHHGGIPTIGDNVSIYSNAVVVGPIVVGDNAIIGALTYVDKDVSPGEKRIEGHADNIGKRIP